MAAGSDTVRVLDHPAAAGVMADLRDASTAPDRFRRLARQMGAMLALEAVRDIPTVDATVDSPLGPAAAVRSAVPIVAVPVLRAGLGLLTGLHDVLPTAGVGMIGLERDEATLEARHYYFKVPPLDGAWVLVLEPMLATGGSASQAVQALDQLASRPDRPGHDDAEGADRVTVLAVVATQQGIDRIQADNPDAFVVTAAIDPALNADGFIDPGLGDFGDRLFGTLD